MTALRFAVFVAVALLGVGAPCPAAAPVVRLDRDGDPLPHGAFARLGTLRMFAPGVTFKAFTPDGRFLMTAYSVSGGGTGVQENLFRIWDLSTGRVVRTFGEAAGVYHAVQSPDGRRVASVGPTGTFLWDVATGRMVRQLEKPQPARSGERDSDPENDRYAFRDENSLVAVRGSWIETVSLADGKRSGRVRWSDEPDDAVIAGSLVLSADGKTLLLTGGMRIVVMDTSTGRRRGELTVDEDSKVAFHPGGKVFAVSWPRPDAVRVYDAVSLRLLREWALTDRVVYNPLDPGPRCHFVPGGQLVAAPGLKNSVDLWDWTTATLVRKLPVPLNWPDGLTFSRDGKAMVASGYGSRIRLFDVGTGKDLLPCEGHRGAVQSLRFADKDTLVSSGLWGGPRLGWDVRTGRVVRSLPEVKYPEVLSPDGTLRACPAWDGTVLLADAATGKKRRLLGFSLARPEADPNELSVDVLKPVVAFSPDGAVLAYAQPFGPIRLWRVATGKECGRLGRGDERRQIQALTFSPDGRLLAVGGWVGENGVEVWDTAKGRLLRRLVVPTLQWKYPANLTGFLGGVDAVAFTPDGRAVAASALLGPVRLWEVASGRQMLHSDAKPGESAGCSAVACSPDGRFVAAAEASGGGIVLWEVASGRAVARFRPTGGRRVSSLAFSPDGRTLASAGGDPTVLLWDVSGR